MAASLPFIDPCVPRPVKQPPKGEHWLHEPKLDGWRCQAVKVGSSVTLYSRHGHDLTKRFPTIATAVAKLPCKSCVLDAEIVQTDARGIDFYGLLAGKQTRNVRLWAFDLLEREGKDLRDLPLVERKAKLEKLLQRAGPAGVGFVASFDDGDALMLGCMEQSLEGVVSKRRDAPYRSGSRPEWVKSKTPTWRQANKDRWERMQGR